MKTVSELVAERGTELLSLLEALLREHSSIYLWNRPGSGILNVTGNHAYRELDAQGRRLQSRLLEEYTEFADLVGVLLKAQPDKVRKSHEKHRKTVRGVVTQEGSTWHKTIDEVWASASDAVRSQIESVENLYSASIEGTVVLVPDTNALLWNPKLEEWSFPNIASFDVWLVPVVLGELDSLKVNHRNADVRERAEGLIRRIKGYRDRGNLRDGVSIKTGVSRLVSVAVEPDFAASLPWLSSTNADDRLVATFIEVMRKNPRSPALLVTRDLNLQNKMEFTRLPFMEPPSPVDPDAT